MHITAANAERFEQDLRRIRELIDTGGLATPIFYAPDGKTNFLVSYPSGDRLPTLGAYQSQVHVYLLVRSNKVRKTAKGKAVKKESGGGGNDGDEGGEGEMAGGTMIKAES